MDPITLALLGSAGVSAIGGIMGFLNSKDANEASQKELNELKKLAAAIREPDFDVSTIPPAQLKVLEQYSPQIASFVPEKPPELVQAMSMGAQKGRGAQSRALEQFEQISQEGTDPLLEMARARALRDAAAASGSAIATSNQNMAQRGMTPGGGLNYAAQLSQAAGAQDALANAGQSAAADQYQRRMAAMGSAADLGSRIRSEDVALESGNLGTLNDYNRRIADMGNQYNQYASGLQNQARQFNIGQNQTTANANVENAYNNRIMNRNYANDRAQQAYGNKLDKLGVQTGQGRAQMTQNQQTAATMNQGIQGLTDAATTGLMAYGQYKMPKASGTGDAMAAYDNPYQRNRYQRTS